MAVLLVVGSVVVTRSLRSRAEAGLRSYRIGLRAGINARYGNSLRYLGDDHPALSCQQRREGDEMACRCGARWPVGEAHP